MDSLPEIPTDLIAFELPEKQERAESSPRVKRSSKSGVTRMERLTSQALKRAIPMIKFMSYDEMNLVFRMEAYFERNRHIGIHWYRQLQRLIHKYRDQWEKDVEEFRVHVNLLNK